MAITRSATHNTMAASNATNGPAHFGTPGRAVLIEGRAGVGKSTVVSSIVARLADTGFMVITITPGFDLAVYRMSAGRPSMVALPNGDASPLSELIVNHVEQRRVALVIDDVNELPDGAARQLRSLIHGLGRHINLVASIRCERGASDDMARFIDDVHQLMKAETITLDPWTVGETVEWTRHEVGRPLSWTTATAMTAWTGGVPGWAAVWIRNLHSRGLLRPHRNGDLELTCDLTEAATVMTGTIDRYLNPSSAPRWALMEFVHHIPELTAEHLDPLAAITDHGGGDLHRAARQLVDAGLLVVGRDRRFRFTNRLIETLVARRFSSGYSRLQDILDALTSTVAHRRHKDISGTVCRLAADNRLTITPAHLLEALEEVAAFDPDLAWSLLSVPARRPDLRDRVDRLHGLLAGISGKAVGGVNLGGGDLGGTGIDVGPVAGAVSADDGSTGSMIEILASQLAAAAGLLSRGRVGAGRRIIDRVLDDKPQGTLGRRAVLLHQLALAMSGLPAEPPPGVEPSDRAGFCLRALLHLRRPGPSSTDSLQPPDLANGTTCDPVWDPMVDWLRGCLSTGPALFSCDGVPDEPLDQFNHFVHHGFTDGAFLIVGLLDTARPDAATRDAFHCLIAESWLSESDPGAVSPLLLDSFDQRIADLISRGHTNAEVAESLGIAKHTVSNRLKVIYRAYGVNARADLKAMTCR